MTTSIMIHSGLSPFKLQDAGTTRVYRDAG
jgi:hypothetical protein